MDRNEDYEPRNESAAGMSLGHDDPLPDIPDAGDNSQPITSPYPIDFSTRGIAGAGSAGMSTLNDGDDQSFFGRTVDAFEEAGVDSPILGDADAAPGGQSSRRVRIYEA